MVEKGSGVAWGVLVAGVLVYDAVAKETLSCGMDRLLESHRFLAIGAVAVTSAHLLNVLPEPIDPLYQISKHSRSFAERYL